MILFLLTVKYVVIILAILSILSFLFYIAAKQDVLLFFALFIALILILSICFAKSEINQKHLINIKAIEVQNESK